MGMGYGVVKTETVQQLAATIDLVAQAGISYLVQPFVPNHGDVRVYIVQGEVITAQHRIPAPSGYLANLSQGGTSTTASVSEPITAWSTAIAVDLGTDWLNVDWLLSDAGPILNEWSSGFGGFTRLDEPRLSQLANAIFRSIRARLER
jgi:glutathione synthase/RimK-type ligase-like ATP-grasp enzyme